MVATRACEGLAKSLVRSGRNSIIVSLILDTDMCPEERRKLCKGAPTVVDVSVFLFG